MSCDVRQRFTQFCLRESGVPYRVLQLFAEAEGEASRDMDGEPVRTQLIADNATWCGMQKLCIDSGPGRGAGLVGILMVDYR
jgi:hypothetical protein